MTRFTKILLGLLLGVVCGVALATTYTATGTSNSGSVYFGNNPSTGQVGIPGQLLASGSLPVITSSSSNCGATTFTAKGGATAGTFTETTGTSCAFTLTFPTAAPNGWICEFRDITTPADTVTQASSTTTTCVTGSDTIASGDTISFVAFAF